MAKFLRQLKTGTIYVYTDILAKRRDMVPYDENAAKTRIKAIKNMLEQRKPNILQGEAQSKEAAAIKADAMELTSLENQLEAVENAEQKAIEDSALPEGGRDITVERPLTTEEAAAQDRQDILDKDPKYIKATGMRSRNEVEEYMLLEFGQEIEISRPFKDLKEYAVEQTVKRILES